MATATPADPTHILDHQIAQGQASQIATPNRTDNAQSSQDYDIPQQQQQTMFTDFASI